MNIRLALLLGIAACALPVLRATEDERLSPGAPSAEQRLQEMDLSLALRQYERVQMELFETGLKLDLLPVDGDAKDQFRQQQSDSLQKRLEILRARADALREAALKASKALASAEQSAGVASQSSGSAEEDDDMEAQERDEPCASSSDLEATLPDGAKIVAGGLFIEWTAPEKGTAILVETCSGRPVKSQTLARDDDFKLDPSETDTIRLLNAMFADASDIQDPDRLAPLPKSARFVLYFAPLQEQ